MIKVAILGSSAAVPSVERSLSAIGIRFDGDIYLFDCGEGTQRQMMKYGLSYFKVKAIFVTHTHADHIVGIAGLAQTLDLSGREEPLPIICPAGQERDIEALLSIGKYSYQVEVRGVREGEVLRGEGFAVSAFPVQHSRPSLGYSFQTDERRNFDEEKCEKLGITGRMFGELEKNGKIKIGKKEIAYGEVTIPKPGIKIVYSGDCSPSESTLVAAKGADLLIHEATYASDHEKEAFENRHSTAAQAAALAKKAGAKRLLLTHISGRYKEKSMLESEAREIFENSEVAEDGTEVLLK